MPFGGMLGSTFNFVFETQLENLQNGDRFYYLHAHSPACNFVTELENNSFAKLIMPTPTRRICRRDVFSTPGLHPRGRPDASSSTTRARRSRRPDRRHPIDGDRSRRWSSATTRRPPGLTPTTCSTPAPTTSCSAAPTGNDILIASDRRRHALRRRRQRPPRGRLRQRHDRSAATATTSSPTSAATTSSRAAPATTSSTAAHGRQPDPRRRRQGLHRHRRGHLRRSSAAQGNDFILGAKAERVPDRQRRRRLDRDRAPRTARPATTSTRFGSTTIVGNDIFLGDGGFDEMIGEGGDDIFVGSEAQDKMDGMSGFDWVTYKNDRFGVTADLIKRRVQRRRRCRASPGGRRAARFAEVEGLSGSAFADILRGDDADAAQIAIAGATGSVLTNIAASSACGLLGTAGGPDGAGRRRPVRHGQHHPRRRRQRHHRGPRRRRPHRRRQLAQRAHQRARERRRHRPGDPQRRQHDAT